MKIAKIVAWLNQTLNLAAFDDVANNGLQLARTNDDVRAVAFGVDASVEFLTRAAASGAQLCVVHHGISWGGGIRRLVDNDFRVVRAAMENDLAIYGAHLPLDANRAYGNNWEISRFLSLEKVKPAFAYHGSVIGVVGTASRNVRTQIGGRDIVLAKGQRVGVCSGGAGEFACAAKNLGCDIFVTGEANWADEIAARNCGAKMVCCGHYATETFGVMALAKAMKIELKIATQFIDCP